MNADGFKTFPLAAVAPGARLAATVLGDDGQVLLTAGTVLTEGALAKLAARGIAAVAVAAQCSEAERDAARAALRLRLGYLFRHCDLDQPDGVARMLFDAVLAHRLEDIR